MKKILRFVGIAALAFAATLPLPAVPVTGSIGFSGVGVTYNTGSAATATAVTSWLAPVVSGTSGSFTSVANFSPVTFAAGTWNFNTVATINNFWAVGGFTFNLLSSAITSQGGVPGVNGFVVVNGVGVVSGNGYTPTTMTWSFTSQDPASGSNPTSWSFSASANTPNVVPDGGATVMLLGIALSGAALLKRKFAA